MRNTFVRAMQGKKRAWAILTAVLLLSGIAHAVGMFRFPYYLDDEGIYLSQAWSVLTQGQLAPYTYWYDHVPGGWLLLALWVKLTGGFDHFGFALNAGRTLMLVVHVFSTGLVFGIARRLGTGYGAAALASLLFALSPLGIYFQRMVLLDNMMMGWLLWSLYVAVGTSKTLGHYAASGLLYGAAVLTKETALVFFPVVILIAWRQSHPSHRRFAVTQWLILSLALISLYGLYAFLKGELFPTGTLLGGVQPHVSLWETILFQMGREGGSWFDAHSQFWQSMVRWWHDDRYILALGGAAFLYHCTRAWKSTSSRYLALLTLAYGWYVMRGGPVLNFYVIPLIPLLALGIALLMDDSRRLLAVSQAGRHLRHAPIMVVCVVLAYAYAGHLDVYVQDQTSRQVDAVRWIRRNIPIESVIAVDNYALVDLRETKGQIAFASAHSYWKIDGDPEIRDGVLKGDWRNIDFILSTPSVQFNVKNQNLHLLGEALAHSTVMTQFPNYGGWDIQIYQVNPPRQDCRLTRR